MSYQEYVPSFKIEHLCSQNQEGETLGTRLENKLAYGGGGGRGGEGKRHFFFSVAFTENGKQVRNVSTNRFTFEKATEFGFVMTTVTISC